MNYSAPGPGYWERDNSHFPAPMSPYLWGLFLPAYDKGTRQGLARYGCVLDHFEFARVGGRLYIKACPVSAAQLAQRARSAEHALQTKLWRQDCASWPALASSIRARLLKLARENLSSMDLPALGEFIAKAREIFVEGTVQHFVQQPASMFPVGDFVRRTCEWTGASPARVITTLQGRTGRWSRDYLEAVDPLAQAIRESPAGVALLRDEASNPGRRLEQLQGLSPKLEEALRSYLDEYADRIITGFDITDATLRELPQFTLSLLESRLESSRESGASGRRSGTADELRALVPPSHTAEFDEAFAEAVASYGLHDRDVRIAYLWPLGLIRRAALVAARHLVERGALKIQEHIFHATPDEAESLMAGRGAPSAAELQCRALQSASWAAEMPPLTLGVKEPGFTREELGPACHRVSSAILFYLGEMEAQGGSAVLPTWSVLVEGLAASPGRYEGRARIICGAEDFAKLEQGDVLVARTTSPAYNILLPTIGAVVTDRGGALCHAAIVAREFGIPAVVGTNDATEQIPDGAQILVDGDRGFVAVCI